MFNELFKYLHPNVSKDTPVENVQLTIETVKESLVDKFTTPRDRLFNLLPDLHEICNSKLTRKLGDHLRSPDWCYTDPPTMDDILPPLPPIKMLIGYCYSRGHQSDSYSYITEDDKYVIIFTNGVFTSINVKTYDIKPPVVRVAKNLMEDFCSWTVMNGTEYTGDLDHRFLAKLTNDVILLSHYSRFITNITKPNINIDITNGELTIGENTIKLEEKEAFLLESIWRVNQDNINKEERQLAQEALMRKREQMDNELAKLLGENK